MSPRNWPDYNSALVRRGSLTLWLDSRSIDAWFSCDGPARRGRRRTYTDAVLLCCLLLLEVYRLPLRATEGLALCVRSAPSVIHSAPRPGGILSLPSGEELASGKASPPRVSSDTPTRVHRPRGRTGHKSRARDRPRAQGLPASCPEMLISVISPTPAPRPITRHT